MRYLLGFIALQLGVAISLKLVGAAILLTLVAAVWLTKLYLDGVAE